MTAKETAFPQLGVCVQLTGSCVAREFLFACEMAVFFTSDRPACTSPSFRRWPEGIGARIRSSSEVPLNYEHIVFAFAQGRLPSMAAEHTDLDCLTGLKELASAFKDKGGNCWWKLSSAGKKEKRQRKGAAGGRSQRKSLMRTKAPERSVRLGVYARRAIFDFWRLMQRWVWFYELAITKTLWPSML